MNSIASVKDQVVAALERAAEWREQKAEEVGTDYGDKNKYYAENAMTLAKYVTSLPLDDPNLKKLAALEHLDYRLEEMHTDSMHIGYKGSPLLEKSCPKEFAAWMSCLATNVNYCSVCSGRLEDVTESVEGAYGLPDNCDRVFFCEVCHQYYDQDGEVFVVNG